MCDGPMHPYPCLARDLRALVHRSTMAQLAGWHSTTAYIQLGDTELICQMVKL